MVGGFELEAKPAFTNYRLIPETWKSTLPTDWDHFSEYSVWISLSGHPNGVFEINLAYV